MKKAVLLSVLVLLLTSFSFAVTLGLSVSTLNNPFFVDLANGAKEKAKELGIDLKVADARDDSAKQLNDVEDLIR